MKIDVLDHGYVRLVDFMGDDQSVVKSARVSYDAEPRNDGSDEKLIKYLTKHQHTSPFESVVFTFEVKAPIFVIRQWHRHRTWSYNEVSARYTELPTEFYVPTLESLTTQSKSNKQMRTTDMVENGQEIIDGMQALNAAAFEVYQSYIKLGVARELARTVLPLATYTRMFATVDLHNLFHFLALRTHEHAQWEIQRYAHAMLELIEPVAPVAVEAFKQYRIENENENS